MPEYQVITPTNELRVSTEDYLRRAQVHAKSRNTIFIPTGLGVLISPKGHRLFSTLGAGEGNIYDLPSSDGDIIENAQTNDVLFCGVTTARIGEFKLLTHAGGPDVVRRLTSRAIDLLIEQGGVLSGTGQISVYCNPEEGYPTYVSGPRSYRAEIEKMIKEYRLIYRVAEYSVSSIFPIWS